MDWSIKSRSEHCSKTEHQFQVGEWFHTILRETPEAIIREDISDEAWEKMPQPHPDIISHWKSKYKARAAEPDKEAVDKNDAESRLRTLITSDDIQDIQACFLLATLLERKRILRVLKSATFKGMKATIYEHAESQETFIIRDPEFNLQQLDSLKDDLSQALETN